MISVYLVHVRVVACVSAVAFGVLKADGEPPSPKVAANDARSGASADDNSHKVLFDLGRELTQAGVRLGRDEIEDTAAVRDARANAIAREFQYSKSARCLIVDMVQRPGDEQREA